jgi:biopolymer transport protein ExbD
MPIKVPGPRLGKTVALKNAKKMLASRGKRSGYAALNLTAMVDMLTIIVVFLLQTFNANGEILFIQKNLVLPDAQNWVDLERAPVIGVTSDLVTLDGKPVANAEDLQKSENVEWKITELHDQLVTIKNNWKLLHPNEQFTGTVIVQSDKNVDFKIVKKVMFSCAVAGYGNVNFAVKPKAKGGAAPAGG